MPQMLDPKVADELEGLRDKWAEAACAIEGTYGQESPAARAFRHCIGDLYKVMQRRGMRPEVVTPRYEPDPGWKPLNQRGSE